MGGDERPGRPERRRDGNQHEHRAAEHREKAEEEERPQRGGIYKESRARGGARSHASQACEEGGAASPRSTRGAPARFLTSFPPPPALPRPARIFPARKTLRMCVGGVQGTQLQRFEQVAKGRRTRFSFAERVPCGVLAFFEEVTESGSKKRRYPD